MTALTSYHKLDGKKHTHLFCHSSRGQKPEISFTRPKSRCWQGCASKENLFLVSSSFLRLPAFLGLSVSLQTLSPWSHHFLLFYIYLLSLCLSLLRALVMAFKPHLGNTGSSPHLVHLMILNHICKDPLSTYSHIYRSMVKTWISFGWAFSASHSACMYLLHN